MKLFSLLLVSILGAPSVCGISLLTQPQIGGITNHRPQPQTGGKRPEEDLPPANFPVFDMEEDMEEEKSKQDEEGPTFAEGLREVVSGN